MAGSRGADTPDLTASVSHEVRTGVSAVLGLAEALLDLPLGGEQRELARAIATSGAGLVGAVEDVLDLAALGAGTFTAARGDLDPRAVLAAACDALQAEAAEAEVRLVPVVDPACPRSVTGDARRLERILLHLLRAAVAAAAPGDLPVGVEITDGAALRVTVGTALREQPTGGLVPPRLAVCAHLACALGGDLGVTAAPGDPVRATLTLPVAVSVEAGEAGEATQNSGAVDADAPAVIDLDGGGAARAPRPARVLLVEDNPVNQRVAQLLLGKLGHHVDTVADGISAVRAVRTVGYDVVVMDLHMPGMDGMDATRAIRASGPAERQPVIVALTASVCDSDSDREAARRAGVDAHLTKPVRAHELDAVIADAPRRSLAATAPAAGLRSAVIARLREIVGDVSAHGELSARLLTAFVTQVPGALTALDDALRRGDGPAVGVLAHGLKGSAANLGADAVARVCAHLEEQAAASDLSSAAAGLGALRGEAGVACEVLGGLARELDNGASGADGADGPDLR